jgi:periplasmic protein TonB
MLYLVPTLRQSQRRLVLSLLIFVSGGQVWAQDDGGTRAAAAHVEAGSSSAQDGLAGPVRRVRTEIADLLSKDGKLVESPRVLLETIVYNRQGRKVDHSVYAVSSAALVGKETYKYDARGNIVEMTVRGDDGAIVSQEIYAYEFDPLGNWTKMTTSVAVIENNNVTYEPTEVTYRAITYYRTDAVAKVILAPAGPAGGPSPPPAASPEPKTEAPEAADRAEVVGVPAGENGQPASARQTASAQPTTPPADEEAGRPSTAAAAETVGDAAAEKTAERVDSDKAEGPAPAPPAPKPPVKAVSGGILNARAINLPRPAYTDSARRSGQEGTVSVEVLIDVTGKVISARAVSGPNPLRVAAEDAARRARFYPTLLSGQPMRISGVIKYNFSLKQ